MDGTLDTGRTLRAILTGTGRAGPIVVRLGRRLVRLVDPDSEEGRSLLDSGRVTLIGPEGESLGYEYDARGDLVAVTDREGHVTRFRYDSRHGLLEIEDPLGRTPIRNEYDGSGVS